VVNGDVEVSNVLDKNYKHTVPAGTFSMIDPEVENGTPRAPTKVGLDSLNSALADFKALPEQLKPTTESAPSRSIASVEQTNQPTKGEIIFISKGTVMNRLPASTNSAYSYFKKKVVKKKPQKEPAVEAPIRFYGMKPSLEPVSQVRIPASVQPVLAPAAPKKFAIDLNTDQEFSNSLSQQKANQPNQSKELENLIQDLKSY
jgi:hypothetical protein